MSISMYEASVPHFVRMLGNLSSITDKAKTHAEIKKIDESVLINARLAPDMYPHTDCHLYGKGLFCPLG